MEHRNIKKNWTEKKGNRAILPIETRMIEVDASEPDEANMHNLMGNLEEHNTQKGHIPFLVFLVIGMILQLTGNTFCVMAGTLICVSACGLICIWVCISAVLSHNESRSLSETPEFPE
jgi:hypothetical protein